MDIKTVRKQPQELLRGGGLIGVCTKILSLFCFFLKSYLISLKPDYTHKVMLYITRVSCYFFSGGFFLMTFIDTDAESTYTDSTKNRKKIKGQKRGRRRRSDIIDCYILQ